MTSQLGSPRRVLRIDRQAATEADWRSACEAAHRRLHELRCPRAEATDEALVGWFADDETALDAALAILADGAPRVAVSQAADSEPAPAGLVGRRAERAALADLLDSPRYRLITLTGVAGCGKSRLAREVLAPDPEVLWVDLTDEDRHTRLPEMILAAAGVPPRPDEDPLDTVVGLLASAPRRLVLDNFDRLVDGGAELTISLLRRVPELSVLVTSRRRLDCDGERELSLEGLPVPRPTDDWGQLLECPSALLFLERALATGSPVELSPVSARATAELCQLLSGLPLALELAAAGRGPRTVEQLLADLRGGGLEAAGDEHDPSQRSLQRAIAWSAEQLTPEELDFFCRLAIFRGGFDLAAAEEVCDESWAIDFLTELRGRSLVQVDEHAAAPRFRLLEVLRDFGRRQLEGDARLEFTAARHFDYYRRLAAETRDHLEREGEASEPLERLSTEHDNLRAALAWALEADPAAALELAGSLWRFWLVRGHWAEAREALDRCLARPETGEPAARARALGWAGHLALRQGDYARAGELLRDGLRLSRELGDRHGEGHGLNELGKLAWARGDYAEAEAHYQASLAIRRELGSGWGIAGTLANLGALLAARGDLSAAREQLAEAHRLRLELGDRRGVSGSLNALGTLAFRLGEYGTAAELFEESLAIRRELDDKAGIAAVLNDSGAVCQKLGDHASALVCYRESLELREAIGDQRGAALTLNNLGIVARDLGNHDHARRCYQRSVEIQRRIGNKQGEALALCNLGELACTLDDYLAAAALYDEALAIQRAIGDKSGIALSLVNLADVHRHQARRAEARALYDEALALIEETGDRWLGGYIHDGLGALAEADGELTEARRLCAAGLSLRHELGDQRGILASLESLARIDQRAGNLVGAMLLSSAAEHLRESIQLLRTPAEQRAADELAEALRPHRREADVLRAWRTGLTLTWREAVGAAVDGWPGLESA